MKNAIIAGASGMVGNLILHQCLKSKEIGKVISLARRKNEVQHSKFKEVILTDFAHYGEDSRHFKNIDIAFFCLGAYTGAVKDDQFKLITVDYAIEFAEALLSHSPQATLCFLSGAGADRTEKSRVSFAKYKGMAENHIAKLGLGAFYTFRPGYIYPVTPRKEPNLMYRVSRALYPVIRLFGENSSIKSTELATAMFHAGLHDAPSEILENRDILRLFKSIP